MNELVERLSTGLHPIVAERSASARELREQIERGFVLLKFPNTRGGTELGSQLDMTQTRLERADFEGGTGTVRLVGNLTLNYEKVQLVADIDLASLKGTGQLVPVEAVNGSREDRTGESAAGVPAAAGDGAAAGGAVEAGKVAGAKTKAATKKRNGSQAR